MAVQPAARARRDRLVDAVDARERVDRNSWPERHSAVVAPRTEGGDDILRAVVNRVRIRGLRRGERRRVRSAADRLVIHAGRLAGALRRQPVLAIVVGERQLAGDAIQLRRERAVRSAEAPVVREQDRIEADARERRSLVFPHGRRRLLRIVERHAQRVVARFDEDLPGFPVHADGRLTRVVLGRCGRADRRRDAGGRGLERSRHCSRWTIFRRAIVHERRDAVRQRRRRRRRWFRRRRQRCDGVHGRGQRRERRGRSDVPQTVERIGDRQRLVARSGEQTVGRARSVIGTGRAYREEIDVGRRRARPCECDRERRCIGRVKSRCSCGEDHVEIVVVAQARRTDILHAEIRDLSGDDGAMVPLDRSRGTTYGGSSCLRVDVRVMQRRGKRDQRNRNGQCAAVRPDDSHGSSTCLRHGDRRGAMGVPSRRAARLPEQRRLGHRVSRPLCRQAR